MRSVSAAMKYNMNAAILTAATTSVMALMNAAAMTVLISGVLTTATAADMISTAVTIAAAALKSVVFNDKISFMPFKFSCIL